MSGEDSIASPERATRLRLAVVGLGLLGVLALILLVRTLGFEWVFLGDEVVFPPADQQYHLRRALYSFVNFPDVLLFDPYINYPGGASVPWPPLFDFALGGVAHLAAGNLHEFEVVVAWAGPVLAALCAIPIYLAGCRVASPGVGLLAGLLFALIPVGVSYTRIGNADHHSAVALIGAWLLYLCMAWVDPTVSRARVGCLAVGLWLIRLAMLLTWHGSLLYLGLAEGILLIAAVCSGRRILLLAQSGSALATLACLLLALHFMPTPLGGDYSSIALSRLHVLAMSAVVVVSAGLWLLESHRPGRGVAVRLLWMLAAAAAFASLVLLLPGPRAGLRPAFQFLTMTDQVGNVTGEQSPLFALFGRSPGRSAVLTWGYLAYLIPVAPLAALWAARRAGLPSGGRAAAFVLAGWGAFFGVLALLQRRYGNDFAPAASLLFSLALCGVGRGVGSRLPWQRGRRPAAVLLPAALGILLLWPAVAGIYLPRARASWAAFSGEPWAWRQAETGVAATLSRFMREVGRVTPETSSYLEPGPPPEYGVIAHANIGHALQYGARRATATDPFWAYIGPDNWQRSRAFLAARDEARALELASELRGRYVVTIPDAELGSLVSHLHRYDGRELESRPRLEHFRLVSEAPASGHSIGEIFQPQSAGTVPYKLFEIVKGAVLEVAAASESRVVATVTIRTPQGRNFVYQAAGVVGSTGLVQIRLPYANGGATPARPRGPYRVVVADREYAVRLPEAAVLHGDVVRLDARDPRPGN